MHTHICIHVYLHMYECKHICMCMYASKRGIVTSRMITCDRDVQCDMTHSLLRHEYSHVCHQEGPVCRMTSESNV